MGGLVVDGALRDLAVCKGLGIPIIANGVTFVLAKTAEVAAETVPEKIKLGNVEVYPGDWFFGDTDVCLLVQAKNISAVFKAARVLRKVEDNLLKKLRSGKSCAEVTGLRDFLDRKGKLRFEI